MALYSSLVIQVSFRLKFPSVGLCFRSLWSLFICVISVNSKLHLFTYLLLFYRPLLSLSLFPPHIPSIGHSNLVIVLFSSPVFIALPWVALVASCMFPPNMFPCSASCLSLNVCSLIYGDVPNASINLQNLLSASASAFASPTNFHKLCM